MRCRMCPRECGAERDRGQTGRCGVPLEFRIARAALHVWEEPCISAGNGSGAVFFSGCPLHCVFCQNREISNGTAGADISAQRLYEIFFELKEQGASNINLVTPTHYSLPLIPVLRRAKRDGLALPVVYNCGGYESLETLRALEGLVDVYLPDLKYLDPETAWRYSGARDYPRIALEALREMVRQRPYPVWDGDRLVRGILVRHLVLPGRTEEARKVLGLLEEEYGSDILISMMSQYTPMPGGKLPDELNRTLNADEYAQILDMAGKRSEQNIYTQQLGSAGESFIPPFDLTGVKVARAKRNA